jgi:hypothetical protein
LGTTDIQGKPHVNIKMASTSPGERLEIVLLFTALSTNSTNTWFQTLSLQNFVTASLAN